MSGSDISMNRTVPSWSNNQTYRSKLPNTRGTTYSIVFVQNNEFSSIVHPIVTCVPQPNRAQNERSPQTAILHQMLALQSNNSHLQLYDIVTLVGRVGIGFQTSRAPLIHHHEHRQKHEWRKDYHSSESVVPFLQTSYQNYVCLQLRVVNTLQAEILCEAFSHQCCFVIPIDLKDRGNRGPLE